MDEKNVETDGMHMVLIVELRPGGFVFFCFFRINDPVKQSHLD